ncbi:MAG: aspartyl/glutamyl-tRNA amidotransferase subunit A [Acidobacteriia bacterium]|nr:aspartyl/glutamyl-tRNA amidotransferase subunit A [Terriglobia bacterium]
MPEVLISRPIHQLAPLLQKKEISPLELFDAAIERIHQLQPKLNSFITITEEQGRRAATEAESEIRKGQYRGPLHGIPISIKDLFATRGVRTTAGSKILAKWIPDYDATAVARLHRAGMVLVGKTHMHEFAYGVTNDNPHYGPARNPWDPSRVPGGSSGGSAAAVASSQCAASLGSDSGGSIRTPAAVCGVVGLKPTYGRVSRWGAIPLAWTLDHVGPLTKSVEDAAIMLAAMAGPEANDPSASSRPLPDYRKEIHESIRGLRLGVPRQYFFQHVDPEIERLVSAAIRQLESLGATHVEVEIPDLENCSAMEAHITLAEATSYHEPYLRKQADDYGPGVRTNLEAGRYLLATDYVKSQRARTLLQRNFNEALQHADVIVSPTLPALPPRVGEVWVQSGDLREHVIDAFLRFNIPYDLTGLPAISVPCGFSSAGLPIGLQIAGRAFEEATILKVALAYERSTSWHLARPALE